MNSCDNKPADSLVAGTFLGTDCDGNPVGAGGSIATCRDVQAAKNEAAQAASNALEKEKQERVAADNTERQERIAADSQEKQERIAADDKEKQERIEADKNLRNETKIKTVKREGDNAIIEMLDGTQYQFSVKDNAFSGDRPVNFAPSKNGDNIEITLADGTVLDMTRQEFAEWLAGKQSPIATDEELRDGIAAAKGDLQKQLDALQKKLDAVNTDQATLEVQGDNLVLTNEDGTKSIIPLSSLYKVSTAAGNAAEVRSDGIYVPTVQGGTTGFDKISPDANNILVSKADGLYAPKTQIKGGTGITVTGDGVTKPYVISGGLAGADGYLPKDVGVSCDPAIQMTTAVKINTIATWASPAVITSTKGDTYSHSLIAHGEYETEDSIQWIASLEVVSPKQINFTVFHPELNYRARYHNGHVYLDVGLREGQTFDGNKDIVFDVTEGECDDNVVGWVDGKKIYGRDIESPKFGDSDLDTGSKGYALPGYLNFNPVLDILEIEYFNKAGEKRTVGLSQAAVVLDPNHPYGNRLLRRNFSKSDNPDIRADVHVNPVAYGEMRMLPNRVDFTKPMRVRIIGKQFLTAFVSVPVKDTLPERYNTDTNMPTASAIQGNGFSYNYEVLPKFVSADGTPLGGTGITTDKLGHQIHIYKAGYSSQFVSADSNPEWFVVNLPQAELAHMNKFGVWISINTYGLSTDQPTSRDPYAALYIMHNVPEYELPPIPYDQNAMKQWVLANPEYSLANL